MVVPTWPPGGVRPLHRGTPANPFSPQRHKEHKVNTNKPIRYFMVFFLCLLLCALYAFVVNLFLTQQSLDDLATVDDLDRPVAGGHQFLVGVDTELVINS